MNREILKSLALFLRRISVLVAIISTTIAGYCVGDRSPLSAPSNQGIDSRQNVDNNAQVDAASGTARSESSLNNNANNTSSNLNNRNEVSGPSEHLPNDGETVASNNDEAKEVEDTLREIEKEYEALNKKALSPPTGTDEKAYEEMLRHANELSEKLSAINDKIYPDATLPDAKPLDTKFDKARNMESHLSNNTNKLKTHLLYKSLGMSPPSVQKEPAVDPTAEITKKLMAQYGTPKKKT